MSNLSCEPNHTLTQLAARFVQVARTFPKTTSVEFVVESGDQQMDYGDFIVKTDDGMTYMIQLRPVLHPIGPEGYTCNSALNPVTFRPESPRSPNVTMGRMHMGIGDKITRRVAVMMYVEGDTRGDSELPGQAELETGKRGAEDARVQSYTLLDEDLVIRGLRLLFPHGELASGADSVCAHLVDWWEGFDDAAVADNELLRAVEPIVAAAQKVLDDR